MAVSYSDRISMLFRERAQISAEHYKASQAATLLTLEHNKLIQQSEQTGRGDGSRQRAQQKALQKGEELRKARSRAEQLARDLYQKETDIADVIAALVAASKLLPSADDTMRQTNEKLAAIKQQLQHIDDRIKTITPAITGLQRVTESAAAQHSDYIKAAKSEAHSNAAAIAQALRDLSKQSRSLQRISRDLRGGQGTAVARLGWREMTELTEPRSPLLPDEEMSSLPENVTILLFASEPPDQERIDLGKEIREILLKIEEARFRDRITLRPWLATEPLDLIPNINRHKPHMVQFSGHGTPDGILMMGPPNRSQPLAADQLIQMLKWSGENLRIVFFNICDSEEHAHAAAQVVDGAIGMRGKLHDNPARVFAASLYSGLAFGRSLKHAFYQACAAIGNEPDSSIPQLFFRDGIDPHEIVLVRPGVDDG
jgi:hypothetical protein